MHLRPLVTTGFLLIAIKWKSYEMSILTRKVEMKDIFVVYFGDRFEYILVKVLAWI